MAASFKAQKIRTSAIIGSGSFAGSRPSILIYSASVADVNGDLTDTGVYTKVGRDTFLFVSGTAGGKGTTGVSTFGGDVVISGTIYNASGTPYSTSGGGSPAGSNGQIQFNDSGAFGAHDGLTYNKNTATLTVGNLVVTGAVTTITTSNLVISDPVIYIASGSKTSNTNGGIAIASGSSVANQALVFGRIANDTWGAGRLDVSGGTVSDLTSMTPVTVRAASIELGGNTAYVSSSANDRLVLYGGSNVQVTGSLFGSSTASFAGNVSGSNALFSGDLAVNGGKITSTFATLTLGTNSNTIAAGGDLRLDTNIIKASGNATAITLTSSNVAIAGSLTVNGFNIIGGASSLAVGDTTATVTTAGAATSYTVGGTSASTDATFSFAPTRTGNVTFSLASGATTAGKLKTINIGSGGTAGTTEVRIGTTGGKSSTFITGALYVSSSQGEAATFYTGISGSLTKLSNGTSFLVAGSNVTITTGSTGQITISSTGGGGGGSASTYFTDPSAGFLNTTGSLALAGNQGSSYISSNAGPDVFFFVSGSIGSRGTSVRGTTLFGGDVVASGSVYISGSNSSLLSIANTQLSVDSTNDFYLNNTSPGKLSYFGVTTSQGVTTNFLRIRPNSSPENTLVSFLQSLGGHNTVSPLAQTDTNFFVGGKVGAIGGATRGAAVFAGDLVISGSAQLLSNSVLKADLLPDGNRTRNLGSDSLRFANVYTGDLHLKNDRGDYTLIEEEDCLTIRFNKSGKRYRFMLERAPEFDEDPAV